MKEGDLKKLREENAQKIFTALCDTAATYKDLLMETYKNRDYAGYLNTLQIITPMKSGPLGTEQLNEALQKLLNDASARPEHCVNLGRTTLALRDKVVHIQNMNIDCIRPADYNLPDRDDHYYTDRIYNGMLGIVIALNRKEETLRRLLSRRQDHRRLFVRRGEGTREARLRADHPQDPGERVSDRPHPDDPEPLHHAQQQAPLYGRHPGQGEGHPRGRGLRVQERLPEEGCDREGHGAQDAADACVGYISRTGT